MWAMLLIGFLPLTGVPTAIPADSLYHEQRPAMGTTFEIWVYASSADEAAALFNDAFEEIERIEAIFSTYRASSELARINRLAATHPVTTDPEVFRFLQRGFAYSAATNGAFDLTVGALVHTWGFFRKHGTYPTAAAHDSALQQTGWEKVHLDTETRTVAFDRAGMVLDPGAMGKGYALDRVADMLRRQGAEAALLSSGQSTYYALGAPPHRPGWPIHVPVPYDTAQKLSTVHVRDAGLSTSGQYEKFVVLDGQRYGHIVDPRSGHPVADMLQTSVVAPTAEASDALSTALFVLGVSDGSAYIESLANTAALFVVGSPETARTHTIKWPASVAPLPKP